ncbi:MAG: sigma-70 family RNA polymerase sigma factor [Deltaproteobacteria bacterium]|nr:sigma-70 family RNA polymerase sigma factor [Deltaproteobacteria bacterium]
MRDEDTDIGGHRGQFPLTPLSAIQAARSDDPLQRARGFTALVEAYWKPVYRAIRLHFHKTNEEAKDLTQAFFLDALERELFESYELDRARFRTFVRTCLRNYVSKAHQKATRIKRGGAAIRLSLDFPTAEAELGTQPLDVSFEEAFAADLAKSLRETALAEVEAHFESRGKEQYVTIFRRYDLADVDDRPTYKELAEELGIKTTDVTNRLTHVRQVFRKHVLARLRLITASEEEFREEARQLLGVEV